MVAVVRAPFVVSVLLGGAHPLLHPPLRRLHPWDRAWSRPIVVVVLVFIGGRHRCPAADPCSGTPPTGPSSPSTLPCAVPTIWSPCPEFSEARVLPRRAVAWALPCTPARLCARVRARTRCRPPLPAVGAPRPRPSLLLTVCCCRCRRVLLLACCSPPLPALPRGHPHSRLSCLRIAPALPRLCSARTTTARADRRLSPAPSRSPTAPASTPTYRTLPPSPPAAAPTGCARVNLSRVRT
nr:vegetative cell wall protein gp1-like [Aegilops tauschii subsp. strangulata]